MCANNRVHYGMKVPFVCLHITLHIIIMQTYLKALNIWNAHQIYSAEYVSEINSILSYFIEGIGCVFSAYPFPSWWLWEYVYFILLSLSNKM